MIKPLTVGIAILNDIKRNAPLAILSIRIYLVDVSRNTQRAHRANNGDETMTNSTKNLVAALQAYLTEIQDWHAEHIGEAYGCGGKYDCVKDVGIWAGAALAHNASAILHYDGAGYDYFSHCSPLEQYRTKIEQIAQAHGFMIEDHNCWSMGFYRA